MSEIVGNIHSIETCGTVDGPGVRFVVFVQGCPMRCLYCHNPDTWEFKQNKTYSVEEVMNKFYGVKEFCKGGITVTGGEPLAQIDFVTELFKAAFSQNIHTALDTSGILFNSIDSDKIENLLKYTSLVMLDIKHIDDEQHKKLTGFSNKNVLEFAKYLSDKNIPMWVRHVVVSGITLDKESLLRLGGFLSGLKNLKGLDVLPYHNMAIKKYDELNIEYKLKDTPITTHEQAIESRNLILRGIKEKYKV